MATAAPHAPPRLYRSSLSYTDRRGKALYIADKYAALLIGSVLDVGCDAAPLRKLVHQPFRYVGVDVRPGADVVVDLDREPLPFDDRQFDTVVCTDVLEHLEWCHAAFEEVCRVARDRVIVSLPNPLLHLLWGIFNGSGGKLKHYGLPVARPEDRHRWLFGHDEAVEFMTGRGRSNGFEVEQIDAEEAETPAWRNAAGEDVLRHPNIGAGTIWCVLRRAGAGGGR
jgi:SAM-dependent methyltransferase